MKRTASRTRKRTTRSPQEEMMRELARSMAGVLLNNLTPRNSQQEDSDTIDGKKQLVQSVLNYGAQTGTNFVSDMTAAMSKALMEVLKDCGLEEYAASGKQNENGQETGADPLEQGAGSLDLCGIQERILTLVAQGYDYRKAASRVSEFLKMDISEKDVLRTMQTADERRKRWQERPLKSFYPILYIDAFPVSFRQEDGQVSKRFVYVVLGVDECGKKEVVHLEMNTATESGRAWEELFGRLKARGLQDVLFVCLDEDAGVTGTIRALFPRAILQHCLVHLVHTSCRLVRVELRKQWCADVKGSMPLQLWMQPGRP